MKYIKDLEAAGFERKQAEAQVQMVLDALEGDLMTKSDFALYKEHMDRRFLEVSHRFDEVQDDIDHRFKEVDLRFSQLELRIVVRLGIITVTSTSISVAILTWLIKIQ